MAACRPRSPPPPTGSCSKAPKQFESGAWQVSRRLARRGTHDRSNVSAIRKRPARCPHSQVSVGNGPSQFASGQAISAPRESPSKIAPGTFFADTLSHMTKSTTKVSAFDFTLIDPPVTLSTCDSSNYDRVGAVLSIQPRNHAHEKLGPNVGPCRANAPLITRDVEAYRHLFLPPRFLM